MKICYSHAGSKVRSDQRDRSINSDAESYRDEKDSPFPIHQSMSRHAHKTFHTILNNLRFIHMDGKENDLPSSV